MRLALVLGSIALFSALWAQVPLLKRLKALEARAEAIQRGLQAIQTPSTRAGQTVWRRDTLYHDTVQTQGQTNPTWLLSDFRTYSYWPTGLEKSDSAFNKQSGTWSPSKVNYSWWFSAFPQESIKVAFIRDPNTGVLVRSDSQVTRFSLAGSRVKVEVSYYEWDQGTWQAFRKDSAWVRLAGSLTLIDSLKIFYYDATTQSWTSYERTDWTYDSQNRVREMHYRYDENPDTSYHEVVRSFYEAAAPGRKIEDSLEAYSIDKIGPGAPNKIPFLRGEILYRYDGNTTRVVADSSRGELYSSGTWFFIAAFKNTYTYDPNSDSLSVWVESECFSMGMSCTPTPTDRYRYVWKRVSVTALGEGHAGSLRVPNPLHAGQWVTLPLPAGQTWRLLNLQGQELARGQTSPDGTALLLPAQPGLYLLQAGMATARLLLLP